MRYLRQSCHHHYIIYPGILFDNALYNDVSLFSYESIKMLFRVDILASSCKRIHAGAPFFARLQ